MSQLWWWCCCRFLFWGAQGASQLPGCEGEGGQSALELGLFVVCFCFEVSRRASQLWRWCCCRFLFWGAQGASQLPGCEGEGGQSALELGLFVVCFCFEVSRRASQLWWWCCCRFLFWGAGASQLPGCEGEGGPVSFGVVLFCGEWRRVSFRGL